jgi:tetratricopeptide (TPR) repeat protein
LQLHGFVLVRREQWEAAGAVLEPQLASNPSPERVRYYLGVVCEHTGKLDKAMEHYKAAAAGLIRERW